MNMVQLYDRDRDEQLLVNAAHIVKIVEQDVGSRVYLTDGSSIDVNDTPNEVWVKAGRAA